MSAEPTPWTRWLAAAQTLWNVSPVAFWALSVREWRALAAPPADAMTPQALAALTARYPDEPHG